MPARVGVLSARPHRLEAQDAAFSRRKPGFESLWGQRVVTWRFMPWASDRAPSARVTMASPPSSRGLGHGPFKAVTGVRIPVGSLAPLNALARPGPLRAPAARETMALPPSERPRTAALSRL